MKKKASNKPTISAAEILEKAQTIADSIIALIENAPDEKILYPANKEFIEQRIDALQLIRNRLHDSDNSDSEIIANAVSKIIDKTRRHIAEIRQAAAERSPESARKFKPPEYEMPAWYNETLQTFIELVERRDELTGKLKLIPPAERAEYQANLSEMNKMIDEGEAAFAETYERRQKFKRYEDGIRQFLKEGSKKELAELRRHLRKNPTQNGVMERLLRDEFPE